MKMKNLNDLFPDWLIGNGLISIMTNTCEVPWKNVVSGDNLDLDYHGNRSGNKLVSPLVHSMLTDDVLTPSNKSKLAIAIFQKYRKNWEKLWDTLNFDYDPIANYDMTETETTANTKNGSVNGTDSRTTNGSVNGVSTGTETGNSSSTSNTKMYGYNSSSPVDSETTTVTGNSSDTTRGTNDTTSSETSNGSNTKTSEETGNENRELHRKGNIGVTTSQRMIEAEREIWFWNYFDRVFADIDTMVTLRIW